MGEIFAAALLVSILWIVWDMAKIYLSEKDEIPDSLSVREPGRQKLNQYAEAFERLSENFLNLQKPREGLLKEDLEALSGEIVGKVCQNCQAAAWCWEEHQEDAQKELFDWLLSMEKGEDISFEERTERLKAHCIHAEEMAYELELHFRLARQQVGFENQLLENRQVMMDQFQEIAEVIRRAAGSIYEIGRVENPMKKQIEVVMRLHGIDVREMWKVERKDGLQELYVTMKALGKKRCVGIREAAACLSGSVGEKMIPARDSRMIINHEYSTVLFMPSPSYAMLCAAVKTNREGEVVSGDSFSMFHRDSGQMILSLSDGMGSGPRAGKESSRAVELMEQFLNAGFDKETAVRMLHTALVLKEGSCFSTMDLAAVNLYTGECELLKVGASTTFLRRGDWVETVSSTSMPMGILGKADYECCKKQLRSGDFLIMISDGVLDAFPPDRAEELVQEIILDQETDNAGELARGILTGVLREQENKAADDMTVLVGGLWRR